MVKNLSRTSEREGTRKLVLGGSAIAAVLFVGTFAWFGVPYLLGTTDYLGRPPTGADNRTAGTTVGTGLPTQREAESATAKNDPADTEDRTGGRGRNIKQTSQPVSLSQEQRDRLRAIFASERGPKMDHPNFELMIGTSVPRQTELANLPQEAAQVLNGYWGGQYVLAGTDLVVVDQNSRRVAAIIGGMQ